MSHKYSIEFENIQVNSIENLSGIFISHSNVQCNWCSHQKSNHGFGSVSGENNQLSDNISIVNDPDEIDNPNIRIGEWFND